MIIPLNKDFLNLRMTDPVVYTISHFTTTYFVQGNMSQQLGNSHRRFLQTLMTCGSVDEPGARSLHQHCCETHNSE